MAHKLKIAIAGCGSRGRNTYSAALTEMRDLSEVVAVADVNEKRRELTGDAHGVRPDMRFESAEALLSAPRLADAILICTQDRQHVPMALEALRRGYHILLEKPISPELSELKRILAAAREAQRKVVVCHVLRYTPYFREVKRIIDSGALGEIASICAVEPVRYWHQAHSFVRGAWRSSAETSPMILQKCCHDLDYLVWLCGKNCERVSSFGSLMHFRPENAPEGSAPRCTGGCAAKADCPYDAEKIYLSNPGTGVLSGNSDWPLDVLSEQPGERSIRAALETGPYGRCVYRCDNDVVDHQAVNMLMEGGATATLTMAAFNELTGRTLRVMGTRGELIGDISNNSIRYCRYGEAEINVDVRTLSDDFSGHAGGDKVMLEKFIDYVLNDRADPAISTLEASVESHLVALAAEESRLDGGRSIEIAPLRG